MSVPILSKYASSLDSHIKQRYLQKIEKIGIDPASLPSEEFDPECLPPIEQSDLFSHLVLQTSYYTNDQFKNYKSLEAYNQVVSGFVASVKGKIIAGKYVVIAKVRHSQRMNDPLVDIWIIAGDDGSIFSAHCLGCKAGLAESCSHVASVLFYIECWTRIYGKLSCTQVKCSWLLPTYVSEVSYARVKDIDFTSAKKLKENLDKKIDSFAVNDDPKHVQRRNSLQNVNPSSGRVTEAEMAEVYKKLNQCEAKAAMLSLVDPYAERFISKSRNVPVISNLFEPSNLDLGYPELLRKCLDVKINLTDDEVNTVEQDTRTQAKGSGFFRHRAGIIGASVCGAAFHTNLAQPSQSLIQSICYPHLFKLSNIKAIKHGCKYEEYAIEAYAKYMKTKHTNFELKRCGLFINKEHPFIHATPDFLVSCDCCGLGCGEVKCPISIKKCDFKNYACQKSSCLEMVNGEMKLKRTHNYYYQVQQQLFTLPERKFADFVVCAVDSQGNAHIVCDRIEPDPQHSNIVMKKLEIVWRICILPEILGRWYTRKCNTPTKAPVDNAICFCRGKRSAQVVSCNNSDCPYGEFHLECLALSEVSIPKCWYCPHCSRLPQFKRSSRSLKAKKQPSATNQEAMLCDTICICNSKPLDTDKLVECHSVNCSNGHFFHLSCLGYKRMPNNSKTTWLCMDCRGKPNSTLQPTTSTSSLEESSTPCLSDSSNSDSEDDIEITLVTTGNVDKFSALANLTNADYSIISDPAGWLNCDIIQAAHILLQKVNPTIEGFQRPTLGIVRNFDVVSGEFIQILHTGNNHWVCVSSIGCLPGMVNLYDSLYNDVITQDIEDQTNDLLGGNLVDLAFVPVQQQNNGSDCGIFSIAFATCLAYSTDPSHVTFDIPRMRSHLLACLKAEKISMFPTF